MKIKIILLFLIIILSNNMFGKCSSSAIYLTSQNLNLNRNGQIIIEFYGSAQNLVSGLTKEYPVYLKNGEKKILLKIIDSFVGTFRITQVILKPIVLLESGQKYTLFIDSIPQGFGVIERYSEKTKKWERPTYTIKDYIDSINPKLKKEPSFHKKTLVYFGCGPASWIYYKVNCLDTSEVFIKVTIKNKKTGEINSFLVPVKEDEISIGHGICSGLFNFQEKTIYEVFFQAIDQSGNKSEHSKVYSVSSPDKQTKEE